MPRSDDVYDTGQKVLIGTHGQDSNVYVNGEPLTNDGESTTVFEEGTGLGGTDVEITATLYDSNGTQVAQITATDAVADDPYYTGEIGFRADGFSDDDVYFDEVEFGDGTTIERFEGDLSAYTGDTDIFQIVDSPAFAGDALEGSGDNGNSQAIISDGGVTTPEVGDTFECRFYHPSSSNSTGQAFGFFAQDSSNLYDVVAPTPAGSGSGKFQIRKDFSALASEDQSTLNDEWTRIVVETQRLTS